MNRSAFAIAAATALTLASTANAAEPVAPANQPQNQAATPRASTLLASASAVQMRTPQNAAEPAPPAKKPRAARVTTCRCGEATPR